MNLRQYFTEIGVTQKFFAQKAKISPVTLWKVLSGEDLKLTTAIRICVATDWKVTPQDMYKDILIKDKMKNESENNCNEKTNT